MNTLKKIIISIFSVVALFSFSTSAVFAHHLRMNTPEAYSCNPGLEISIQDNALLYNPLISTDCPLFFGAALSHFYELMSTDIVIEHEVYMNGSWQSGPRSQFYAYNNWDLDETNHLIWDYYQINGLVSIEGYNNVLNRYRLVVTLNGATTHEPFTDGYDTDMNDYESPWIYGTNPIRVSSIFNHSPNSLTDTDDNSLTKATCHLVGSQNGTWYCSGASEKIASDACSATTGTGSQACSTQPDGGVECACVF